MSRCPPFQREGGQQWRNEGGKGGRLPMGAALWGHQIEVGMLRANYEMSNVERMLTITINEMSKIIAKSNQDHQRSQSEQLWILLTFQGGVSVSSDKHPLVVRLTAASQCFQKARVANFPTSLSFYSCITMWRESSFHSACRMLYCVAHAFRATIKLTQCCCHGCADGGWTRRRPQTAKAVGHPKSEITKSAFIKIL